MSDSELCRLAAQARRAALKAEGEAAPRFVASQRRRAPPPPWFTFLAAMVPALPYVIMISASTLVMYFPVYVAVFYLGNAIVPQSMRRVSLCLLLCFFATGRALANNGWSGIALVLLTVVLGMFMHLAESAMWDTFEPFLVGQPGFGAGTQIPHPPDGVQRVTAASAIRKGDPDRAAAASAFTQAELDALTAQGIMPWDAKAKEALRKLET